MKQHENNVLGTNLLVIRWGAAAERRGQAEEGVDGLDRLSQGLVEHLGRTQPGCHLLMASSTVIQSAPAANWDWCSLPADQEQACRVINKLRHGLSIEALVGVGESCRSLLRLLAQGMEQSTDSTTRMALIQPSADLDGPDAQIVPIQVDWATNDFHRFDDWLRCSFPNRVALTVADPDDSFEIERNWAALKRAVRASAADPGSDEMLRVTLRWQSSLGAALDRCVQRIIDVPQVARLRIELLSNLILPLDRRGLTHSGKDLLVERGFWRFVRQLGRLLLGVPKEVELVFISDSPRGLIRNSVSLTNRAGRLVRLLKTGAYTQLPSVLTETALGERFDFDPAARLSTGPVRLDVLFFAIDGRGLGHLNRTLLLAQAVCTQRPGLDVAFVVESPAAFMVAREGFQVSKMPDPLHPLTRFALAGARKAMERSVLQDWVRLHQPRLIVFDFWLDQALLAWLLEVGVQVVVVLRRLRTEALEQLARLPAAGLVSAWIIPHNADEFAARDNPGRFLSPCHFVGPLVRALDPRRIALMRKRIAAMQGDQRAAKAKLVVVSVGGGGTAESVRLVGAIREALHVVQERLGAGRFFVVVVCGPLFPRTLFDDEPRIRFQYYEPDLPALMAAADVVISTAGYNSVNELVASGTPGILIPLFETGRDDQVARAAKAGEEGLALVCEREKESIASALTELLQDGGRERNPSHQREGNRHAGRVITALIN